MTVDDLEIPLNATIRQEFVRWGYLNTQLCRSVMPAQLPKNLLNRHPALAIQHKELIQYLLTVQIGMKY
jgi:hypothetical protein